MPQKSNLKQKDKLRAIKLALWQRFEIVCAKKIQKSFKWWNEKDGIN